MAAASAGGGEGSRALAGSAEPGLKRPEALELGFPLGARVTDVAAPFAMSLNAVSKHIKVLEGAGLVRRTRRGREHALELEPGPLREVARWTSRYERFWTERLDRMEAFFAEKRRRS